VSQDYVGLFDTPPSPRQIRFAWIMVVLLSAAMVAVLASPNYRVVELNAVVPVIDSLMLICDLITATLLYVQASVFRSRALTVLASGFLFVGLLLVSHMLTFPGAFAPGGLLGAGLGTTGWSYLIRWGGFPVAVILYVRLRSRELAAVPGGQQPSPLVLPGIIAAFALAVAATLLVTLGHDLLPPLFYDRYRIIRSTLIVANSALGVLVLAAIAILYAQRRSVLDMWLLVALFAWLIQFPVNLITWARYTVGFYAQFALMPTSHLILMLALLAESSRLYAQLALTTAARKRERNALLMSMDAMAATFAHEIGQPFTAVTTNAKAGLNYLTRPSPNVEKAIEALRAALDAGKLTSSVIKSLRAMVATEPGTSTEFCSNDLVRQTSQLLHRELEVGKVSLDLQLDEAHRRPPCSSASTRLIARPRPVPVTLVVTKASKMRSMSSDAMPPPVSVISSNTA
jgi:signal transduction histidine kinase